jgi:hypothetical protein
VAAKDKEEKADKKHLHPAATIAAVDKVEATEEMAVGSPLLPDSQKRLIINNSDLLS